MNSKEAGGLSLHGHGAARRQATAEFIFFASVGDLERCLRIVNNWNLTVKTPFKYLVIIPLVKRQFLFGLR